jgi:uncharacterized OB-fold protein
LKENKEKNTMSTNTIELDWNLDLDFAQPLGETYTEFMDALKDKKFLGTKIGDQTFFPSKPFCNKTYNKADETVECDGTGKVESFTIYHKEPEGVEFPDSVISLSPPYVVAVIRINNSDQSFLHLLSGVDVSDPMTLLEKVKAGLEVKPVWAEERHGNILDIKYFEPVA